MIAVAMALALQLQASPAYRIEANVMIPMRDGVRLATDLYRPLTGSGPWPVVLIRTPYDKTRDNERLRGLPAAGYVLAIQDVRGKYNSEGRVRIQADDPDDGYDSVDWLSRQPWFHRQGRHVGLLLPQGSADLHGAAPPSRPCRDDSPRRRWAQPLPLGDERRGV